ncbi:MAG: DNA topoisomerase (ATP-hydrolyzing) subunit A [Spirochaetia bacterium]
MENEKIILIPIEDELKTSYLNYAMSVIVSRALPDVRDGLKPVHRRILYVLSDMKLDFSAKTKKCAQIVGEVMGKYHPHGDAAIYDTLVRMAQSFSLRYPLVLGQGNFGTIEGDPPAAYRYTEAKMTKITETMLRDIKKETVRFSPTYDGTLEEPNVLPTAIPNLLVNGSSGIAVGMATNMAPHNLKEVCQAVIATLDNPEIDIDELLTYIKGPDFPTAATIHGRRGYRSAAYTGRGAVVMRAKTSIEQISGDRESIVITELPYMTNMKNLLIHMAELVKDKKVDSISDIRNESTKQVRIVIELKRGSQALVVLNQLYQHTALQSNFNMNNLALVDGQPKVLNLKQLITYFIKHRFEVIERRSRYDLRKLREREHILQGLKIAIENIDAVIELIKTSPNAHTARERLIQRYGLSEIQAQAILDMRLQRLTNLETQKIMDELSEILKGIGYLEDLLAHPEKIYTVVREETEQVIQTYGDERRTEIVPEEIDGITTEDLIEREDMVVLISKKGFIKRVPLAEYREQGRGGKGSLSVRLGDDDIVSHIFTGSTHDVLFFVTTHGRGYWLKLYQLPEANKTSKGRHLHNLFEFEEGETITAMVCFDEFKEDHYLFMCTHKGVIKRVNLSAFKNAKTRGIIAIDLDEGDKLTHVEVTPGGYDVILTSHRGKALKFNEDTIRVLGRVSRGVRGLRMAEGDHIVGLCVGAPGHTMFVLSENGYGKRVEFSNFNSHARGTGGQRIANTTGKFGPLLTASSCDIESSVLVITAMSKTIKIALEKIPVLGRNAGGVRIVQIEEGDLVVGMSIASRAMDFTDADQDMSEHQYDQKELFGGETSEEITTVDPPTEGSKSIDGGSLD